MVGPNGAVVASKRIAWARRQLRQRGGPLLLPPGSVLQFGDPLGELVVTRVRVIFGEDGGSVCAEAVPVPKPRYRTSADPGDPAEWPGHVQPVPDRQSRWSRVRPGNG